MTTSTSASSTLNDQNIRDNSSRLQDLLASHNTYPAISWLEEAFLSTIDRSQRIAAGSPLITTALLDFDQIQEHINRIPTLLGLADFLPQPGHDGRIRGARPKMTTWPL